MNQLILHICCFPCLFNASDQLYAMRWDRVVGVYHNPNIHPYTEYMNRWKALLTNWPGLQIPGLEEVVQGEYDFKEFLRLLLTENVKSRCELCYTIRFTASAKLAVSKGFGNIATTLMTSPFQNRELMISVGTRIAEQNNIRFVTLDAVKEYSKRTRALKDRGIYVQKYCGCIFSEYERYSRARRARNVE